MQKANPASVPRSERILGRAICTAAEAVGDLVYIAAAKTGNSFNVAKADLSVAVKMPAVGVLVKKYNATSGIVQFHGPIRGLYTLVPGYAYFVGTNARPAREGDLNYPSSGVTSRFQQVGVSTSNDELLLNLLAPSLGGSKTARYFQQVLSGAINGVNTTYTTVIPFATNAVDHESVYLNGVLQERGGSMDYTISESVPGAGYDTVTFAVAPRSGDKVTIDFVPGLN